MAPSRVASIILALVGTAECARLVNTKMRSDDNSPFADEETTVNGCTCTQPCGTSIGAYYKCDWCNVPRSCSGSQWGLTRGHWDHCAFNEVSNYEAQSANTKGGRLWSSVMLTRGQSKPLPSTIGLLKKLLTSSMRAPFDNTRDTVNEGREKVIHDQGVVCKFDLEVSSSSPYTGGFEPGRHPGLMRIGSATPAPKNFPGVAIKFMRSGVVSGNFVALRESGDQTEGTFFAETLTNHVPPPGMLEALQKFQQSSDCVSMIGLSDVCRYNSSGAEARSVNFPYKVMLRPHADTARYDADGDEVLGALARIPSGTRLWDLFAQPSPTGSATQIGTFKTTSQCHTTLFGDEHLHFRHQRMEEDFRLRPAWVSQVDWPGCTASTRNPGDFMCGDTDAFPEE